MLCRFDQVVPGAPRETARIGARGWRDARTLLFSRSTRRRRGVRRRTRTRTPRGARRAVADRPTRVAINLSRHRAIDTSRRIAKTHDMFDHSFTHTPTRALACVPAVAPHVSSTLAPVGYLSGLRTCQSSEVLLQGRVDKCARASISATRKRKTLSCMHYSSFRVLQRSHYYARRR